MYSSSMAKDNGVPGSIYVPYARGAERAFAPVTNAPDLTTALIVLDANVLLAPYQTSSAALKAIERVYAQLREQGRLVVPAQAAREFAKRRPSLVAELVEGLNRASGISLSLKYEAPPVLRELDTFKAASQELETAKIALREYRKRLAELAAEVMQWDRSDPVLKAYHQVFDASVVQEVAQDAEAIETTRKARFARDIPPGYKDKGKEDGGIGDLIIWLTILECAVKASKDVVFVTEEKKADWFHRAGDQPVFPRYELALEFEEATSGRSFCCMTLSKVLETFGVASKIVEEVREVEADVRPEWQEAEAIVLNRLVAVGVQVDRLIGRDAEQAADFRFESDGVRVGVEVVAVGKTRPDFSSRILRATRAVNAGHFDEVVIVFVTRISSAARYLRGRFLEETFLGHGVAAIVLEYHLGQCSVLTNQSRNHCLQAAFPIDGKFRDSALFPASLFR